MSTERFNRNLLFFCLAMCGLMYIDSYFIPLKDESATVLGEDYYSTTGRRTYQTYEIETENGHLPVTRSAFYKIDEGDRIVLMKSIVTQSIQKIRLSKGGYDYTFGVGFVRARSGFGLIPMLCICIVVNLSANRRLVGEGKQKYLPYVWLTGIWVLLAFHLGLESIFR